MSEVRTQTSLYLSLPNEEVDLSRVKYNTAKMDSITIHAKSVTGELRGSIKLKTLIIHSTEPSGEINLGTFPALTKVDIRGLRSIGDEIYLSYCESFEIRDITWLTRDLILPGAEFISISKCEIATLKTPSSRLKTFLLAGSVRSDIDISNAAKLERLHIAGIYTSVTLPTIMGNLTSIRLDRPRNSGLELVTR